MIDMEAGYVLYLAYLIILENKLFANTMLEELPEAQHIGILAVIIILVSVTVLIIADTRYSSGHKNILIQSVPSIQKMQNTTNSEQI